MKEIKVRIHGLETKEDKEAFYKRCADCWMEQISEKISALDIPHARKIEFAKEVVDEINRKAQVSQNKIRKGSVKDD